MNKNKLKKGIAICIFLLFLGAGTLPAISSIPSTDFSSFRKTTEQNNTDLTEKQNLNNLNSEQGRYSPIFNQPPTDPKVTQHGHTSESNAAGNTYTVFENIWDVDEKIDKIVWWGLASRQHSGNWIDGSPEGMNFYINFYDDPEDHSNAPPQDSIYSLDVPTEDIQITHTGVYWNETLKNNEHIKFEYILPDSISLTDGNGWVSIQSHDDPEGDWFLWLQGMYGDIFSYQEGSFAPNLNQDKAFHLYTWEEDTTPPTVSLEKPKAKTIYVNNQEISTFPLLCVIIGSITFNVTAQDDGFGMDHVEIYIDDDLQESINSTPYTWRWDQRIFGMHTITVKAFDQADNMASEELTVFKLF
jgi:hypothetical protein